MIRGKALLPLLVFIITIILVEALPASAATYYVSPSGSDTNPGTSALAWRTLQKASATMVAGDTALIADGEYPGGITQTRAGAAGAPITFRAVNPGGAVVRGDQTADRFAFYISWADHIVVDGLTVRQANGAGIRVSLSNSVTVRRCRIFDSRTWGIFTDYSDDLLIEYNECAGSVVEHGIYVSNSGDRPVVRFNVARDNRASGIQINADPGLLWPELGTRGDGITDGAIVEGNVVYNNGAGGGAALNLMSLRYSRVFNNLLYNNRAGGIAGSASGYGPAWGCKNNEFTHNTVYFRPTEGRWALSLKEGSTDNRAQNNILHGGARGAIEIDNDSSVTSNYNVLRSGAGPWAATNEDIGTFWTLAQWQAASSNDRNSTNADPRFASPTTAPFDFHLLAGSPAVDTGVDQPGVTLDLDGRSRPQSARWDMGCYERPAAAVYTLAASPTSVNAGSSVTVAWTAPSGHAANDWIGLFRKGDPDTAYLSWFSTGAATSGSQPVAAPSAPGEYEFRLFLNNGWTRAAASSTVTVTAPTQSGNYSLSGAPTTVTAGGSLTVSWTAPSGHSASDWIGLFRKGDPDTAYLSWFSTGAATSGSQPVTAPGTPGEYEFRLFLNNGWTRAAASNAVTVTAPTETGNYSLAASPATVTVGGSVAIAWTAPAGHAASDWIGLFRKGDPNTAYGAWFFIGGATSGSQQVTAPATPGEYEFRYLLNRGYTSAATSNTVTVR